MLQFQTPFGIKRIYISFKIKYDVIIRGGGQGPDDGWWLGGGGVKKWQNCDDVICGRPHQRIGVRFQVCVLFEDGFICVNLNTFFWK